MNRKVIVFGVDGMIPELLYKFAGEGSLPNLSKMLKQGASAELLPYISTWGDVNFVSFMTGQAPGTSWKGQRVAADNRSNLLGYMDRQNKKCALVHFPETVSAEGTRHFQFAPFGKGAFELASPMVYTTHPQQWPEQRKTEYLGWPPAAGTLAYHEKANRSVIETEGSHFRLAITTHDGHTETIRIEPLDRSSVCLTLNDGTTVTIAVGQWAEWTEMKLGEEIGIGRFKLLAYDPERMHLDLLQSQINRKLRYSNDTKLEAEMLEHTGPFISKWTVSVAPDLLYMETGLEEGEYQAMWLARAAEWLLNHKGYDMFATVFRLIDETHHTCLGEYDPASPFYSQERAKRCEQVMRSGYIVLDRAIGELLRHKSDDTLLIVASDHGDVPNAYMCDIYVRLAQSGLCTLDQEGLPIMSRSKAYLKKERGGMEIFVNLKGREAEGIVDPGDYDKVQTEIFQAISTWYYETPEGMKNVAGITVKKQDASPLGFWGEAAGDVLFAYNQGFVWGYNHNRDAVAPVTSPGANHGPQIPTAATAHSSNYGIALFYGPEVRQGARRDRTSPYKMNDMGTTIARMLGLQGCEGLDGRLMHDLLELNRKENRLSLAGGTP